MVNRRCILVYFVFSLLEPFVAGKTTFERSIDFSLTNTTTIIFMEMNDLQPVLLGWNVRELWDYIHPVALAGWAVLCLAPRWKHTFALVLVPPLLHAVLYSCILLPILWDPKAPKLDFFDMESVWTVFTRSDVFFCGWVHYLAFDLLVARGMAHDAVQECRVSYLQYYVIVVPCLLATLYAGPTGYLLYMVLRWAVLWKPVHVTNGTTKTKKK